MSMAPPGDRAAVSRNGRTGGAGRARGAAAQGAGGHTTDRDEPGGSLAACQKSSS